MVRFGPAILLLIAADAFGQVGSMGQAPSPLVPYPPEHKTKPVYSQDHYKRDPTPEPAPEEDEPPKLPVYSQDKYFRPDVPDDYSDELRKIPERAHEWSEIEITKGTIALNADKFDDAIKHFQKALEHDPRNFVALEYLASTSERKGNLQDAIAYLAKAKHLAPKGRWGQINFQMGRIYLGLKNYERSEIYLRLALDQGGQATATNYTLGYLLYLEKRWFEAEHHLHEARMRALRRTALPVERQLIQSIDYYLGEIYARLGFIQYGVAMLRDTEVGDSWEVRNGAWRVHSELNHPMWYATLGLFGQYDTNVVLVPIGGVLPIDFSSQSALSSVFTTNAGWQTSPAKSWVGGIDGSSYLNNHLNNTLGAFDVLDFALDLWGSWWNQRDWAFTLRYDLNDALTDRSSFSRFQSDNAITVSANYFPFQRWNWEAGFQYRSDNFATDLPTGADQRSGYSLIGFVKGSLKAPNPRLRPSFGYTFEADAANGVNFQSRNHTLFAEADWRLFSKTHLIGGITFEKSFYPNHLNGRLDTIEQIRLGVNQVFDEHWVGVLDINSIEDASTLGTFSYQRLVVTCGATYTFVDRDRGVDSRIMLQTKPNEEQFSRFIGLLDRYESHAAAVEVKVCRAPLDEARRLLRHSRSGQARPAVRANRASPFDLRKRGGGGRVRFESPRLLWRYLVKIGGAPCSDIFDKISETDVVEVFSLCQQLCYVNFKFFERDEFHPEQVFTLTWHNATTRDPVVLRKMKEYAGKMLSGEQNSTFDPGLGWHKVKEVGSELQVTTEMLIKWVSPIFSNHKISGFIVVLARR